MRIFKTIYFNRLAVHEGLSDQQIVKIVKEMEAGLHNGDLGGGFLKSA